MGRQLRMEATNESLTADDVFDVLSNEQRRKLLVSLIADSPPDAAIAVDPAEDLSFYHTHLPKLDAHGLVDWRRDTHEVTRGPNFEAARPLLELLVENRDRLPADWV